MPNAKILGTGIALPERRVTNAELSEMLGEDIDEFVSGTLGIRERRVLGPDESAADLASKAAESALGDAGISAEEIDLIIIATDTPEYISPATSVVVQHRIGASNAGTFDVNAACAGFVTAFDIAAKYIAAGGRYRKILVIGVYAMTKFLDWKEKKTATIFADGAGAVVIGTGDNGEGLLASKLVADGRYHNYLGIFAGGSKYPITEEELREGYRNKVRFAIKFPPEVNLEGWPKIVRETLAEACISSADVRLFLWTQVNLSTIREVMAAMGLEMSRTHTIMDKWGYTGSACIPMALDDAIRKGKLSRGDYLVMCASGGGLNMAAAVLRY